MWELIGSHHPFPPEPIIAEDTVYVDAGCVRIGVEQRRGEGINDRLQAGFEGSPFEGVFLEWLESRPQSRRDPPDVTATMADAGNVVSLHVVDAQNGHEHLRFDCFQEHPHYHYLRPWTTPEECDNHSVEWDHVAHGPMMPWAIDRLRTRLSEMLTEAGGADLAARLDQTLLDHAVDQVESLVTDKTASMG